MNFEHSRDWTDNSFFLLYNLTANLDQIEFIESPLRSGSLRVTVEFNKVITEQLVMLAYIETKNTISYDEK